MLLAVIATLLAGAAPAWMSWRTQPQEALRGDSRSASESRSGKQLRKTLVAAEVAVSVTLVLMTGLLTASLYRLMHVERGFQADRVLTATIELPGKEYPTSRRPVQKNAGEAAAIAGSRKCRHRQRAPARRRLLDRHGAHFLATRVLFSRCRPSIGAGLAPAIFRRFICPWSKDVFSATTMYGRNVAVVSALTAKTLWPGKDPIGQQFTHGGMTENPSPWSALSATRGPFRSPSRTP